MVLKSIQIFVCFVFVFIFIVPNLFLFIFFFVGVDIFAQLNMEKSSVGEGKNHQDNSFLHNYLALFYK